MELQYIYIYIYIYIVKCDLKILYSIILVTPEHNQLIQFVSNYVNSVKLCERDS